MVRGTRLCTIATLALVSGLALPKAQDKPLPDLHAFLGEARAHLKTDRALLAQYTYLERRHDIHLSKLGKVTTGPVHLYQVYPGIGPVRTYRRLIEIDGKPRSQAELEKEDREHQRKVAEVLSEREKESASDRAKREARRAKAQREEAQMFDDLARVYDFRMIGRETIDGRPVIAIDFAPKADAAPVTDEGKMMKRARGRAWISEQDYQVARVEIEVLDDIAVGLGILGKLYKGTTASFARRKINDEAWLPAEMRITASGRAFVRKFHIDEVVQYSDYRKFSVETDTTFALPKKPQ